MEGEIKIEDGNAFDKATIYVRIEDTSEADTSSKILSEQKLENVSFNPDVDQHVIRFNISIPTIEKNRMYTVSVHIDINGNGKLDKGDYINMESFPLPLQDSKNKLVVKVKQIT
jgi:uncharacterized lipoprotein YbaY